MAGAILQRLAAWLAALWQDTQADAAGEGDAEPLSPLSPGAHVNGGWAATSSKRSGAADACQLLPPVFSGVRVGTQATGTLHVDNSELCRLLILRIRRPNPTHA